MTKRTEQPEDSLDILLLALVSKEGDTVTVHSPDAGPDDRVAVDCSGSWTHYKPRRFMAGSIRRCVLEALAAKALS